MHYLAFGLSVRANRAVPGLQVISSRPQVDVHLWLAPPVWPFELNESRADPHYVSAATDGQPALHVSRIRHGTYFRLRYRDGTDFVVDRCGTEIWARWAESSTLDDTATYLLGPVLGFVLRLRGVPCLHASAVAIGSRAVAIAGPAGAGKSTIAAAFASLGYPVLADDVVALDESDAGFQVRPAYPRIRLWPESVTMLYGFPNALPRLTPSWDKRALDLTEGRFQVRSLPLAAIYVLREGPTGAVPCVERCHGRESVLTLLANSYVTYLLDSGSRGEELRAFGRLAADLPVRRLTYHRSSSAPSVCAAILNDCEALGCTPLPTTVR